MASAILKAPKRVEEVECTMSSLLELAAEPFVYIDKSHVRDEEGNVVVTWIETDVRFNASVRLDNSIQAKRAQAEGVKDLYTIITRKDTVLGAFDVVKRIETGEYYRITTNGRDNKTPASAGLNMRAVSAERWELPDD